MFGAAFALSASGDDTGFAGTPGGASLPAGTGAAGPGVAGFGVAAAPSVAAVPGPAKAPAGGSPELPQVRFLAALPRHSAWEED